MLKKIFIIIYLCSITVFSQMGINTSSVNINSFLHVSAKDDIGVKTYKGIIFQKYTVGERDVQLLGLTEAENGLIIYNKTEGCFNYWRQSPNYPLGKWASYGNCTK